MTSRSKVPRTIVAGLCLAALVATPALLAQDGGMASVLTVHVKLGEQQRYEAALAKLWAAFKKAGLSSPITVGNSVDQPGDYTFIVPVADFAAMGSLMQTVQRAFASAPDVAAELDATTLSEDQSLWAGRADLTYTPANPRLGNGEQGYSRVAFLYPYPDQVQAFEAAVKDAVAMYKKHGIATGRFVAQQVIGADSPAYVVVLPAKDEVDFYTQNAKDMQALGADWQAYISKVGPMLRHVEISGTAARRDLTYQP